MCFSPAISLTTALIEFLLAVIILWKFRRSHVTRFIAALIIVLGIYQFTEFMVCTTGNLQLWGTVGYVTYTLLPALGLHFVLKVTRPKEEHLAIYLPAVIFQGFAVFSSEFITGGSCSTIFVRVSNTLFHNENPVFYLYLFYYFGYIIYAVYLMGWHHFNEQQKHKKQVYALGTVGLMVSLIPPVVFIILFPAWSIMFPSIYCEFALIFAILAFAAAHIDDRYGIKYT